MKTSLFAFLVVFASMQALAADEKAAADPKAQERMKKMQEYATPGDAHKTLASMAGKWKVQSKWWESADGKPQESAGTSTMKMVLGGRFLQQEFKGKAMGQPFEGMALTGYNNLKGEYESLWIDNMGTGMTRASGSYDAGTKTMNEKGEFSCPITGDKERAYRSEWKMADKDHSTFTMFMKGPDGKEFKSMEMAYTRAK
jgi:hypothetical protein